MVCLCLAVAAHGAVVPVPIKKPFWGPIPLPKPTLTATVPDRVPVPIAKPRGARSAIHTTCARIARKLSSVSLADCLRAGLSASIVKSVLGTPILVTERPSEPLEKPRARVLLIGGTHGDEYSSVSVVFKWIDSLAAQGSGGFHWRIVPVLNPDGLLRENSTRTNANGVDLNRNFPTPNWAQESQRHWIQKTGKNSRRFPGLDPGSEPESRWLVNEIALFKPDVIIATHAPHGIVDFDGPPHGPKQLGSLSQHFLGTYPGSLGNFAGLQLGLPVVTVEFSSAGRMPPNRDISKMLDDLKKWLKMRFPTGADLDALRADAGNS